MTQFGEYIMLDKGVGVRSLRLAQRDGASIHWTPGVSEHVPAKL